MSNLLKSFTVVSNENKRVIDSNEAMTEKLMEIRKIMTDFNASEEDFTLGINPEDAYEILKEDSEVRVFGGEPQTDNEGLLEEAEDIISDARKKAEEIVGIAEAEASKILQSARSQAETIRMEAQEVGFSRGVESGKMNLEAERENLEKEFSNRTKALEEEHLRKRKELEPELVDVMIDIFANLTRALSTEQRDMILALVDKVLNGGDASNNYIIKVCKEDAEFLRENKESILKTINRDINLEIVEDVSMQRNQCLIDTDMGIYDCSLDIQLENLIRSIKILSCQAER